jgi:hypothetical protein
MVVVGCCWCEAAAARNLLPRSAKIATLILLRFISSVCSPASSDMNSHVVMFPSLRPYICLYHLMNITAMADETEQQLREKIASQKASIAA